MLMHEAQVVHIQVAFVLMLVAVAHRISSVLR